MPLLNKIIWVTGAGSGIGEAAKAGGAVVLTGRRREPLETVAHRIRAEAGTAHVEPGDLMDPDAVKRIGAAINDKIGHLDILVNNAGVNINDRHWDKLTPENAKLMIDGNLAAAAQCVTVALPLMRKYRPERGTPPSPFYSTEALNRITAAPGHFSTTGYFSASDQ